MKSEEIITVILSYLGFLVFIPLVVFKKKNAFMKFHIQQGMNMFILQVIISIADAVFKAIPLAGWMMCGIVSFVTGILIFLIGIFELVAIIQGIRGKMWKIPLFSDVKIFKIN